MDNFRIVLFFGVLLCFKIGYTQSALKIGDKAFDFEGTDQFGNNVKLFDELKDGPVVLLFYRGYWCPYCNKQLSELEDTIGFITRTGGKVIAVTPEKPESIEKTIQKTKASFKIIYDVDMKIMTQYDVVYALPEKDISRILKKNKANIFDVNGENGANLPVPATYVINQEKEIVFAFYDPNYKRRANLSHILNFL